MRRNPNECRDGTCGGCTKCRGGVDEEWQDYLDRKGEEEGDRMREEEGDRMREEEV